MAHISGLVAAGVVPSPFHHCDIVSTTTHKTLRGCRAGVIFYRKGCHQFCLNKCFVSLLPLFFPCWIEIFVFSHFLPPSSTRCKKCWCQRKGDSVQSGVLDQPGCVSRAAGRTTQPCHCRYPAHFHLPSVSSCQLSSNVSLSLTGWNLSSAGVAVALKQAMTPEFKAYQSQVLENCKALSSALMDLGYKIVTGKFHKAFNIGKPHYL